MSDSVRPVQDAQPIDAWAPADEPPAPPSPELRQRVARDAIVAASPLLRSHLNQAAPVAASAAAHPTATSVGHATRASYAQRPPSASAVPGAFGAARARATGRHDAAGFIRSDNEAEETRSSEASDSASTAHKGAGPAADPSSGAAKRPQPSVCQRERHSHPARAADDAGLAVRPLKTHLPQAPEAATDLLRIPVPPVMPVVAASAGPASARRHRGRGLWLTLFALSMAVLCAGLAGVLFGGHGSADGGNSADRSDEGTRRSAPHRH